MKLGEIKFTIIWELLPNPDVYKNSKFQCPLIGTQNDETDTSRMCDVVIACFICTHWKYVKKVN